MPIPAGPAPSTVPDWTPTGQDIADVIPRRAVDDDGLGRGTFTTSTVPTETQAERIGVEYATEVAAAVPDLPAQLEEQARKVAALGAAAQIELSFYPETASTVATSLRDWYRQALDALTKAVELATGLDEPGDGEQAGSGQPVPASPRFSFPDVVDISPGAERPLRQGWYAWPYL